ncbi:ATPase, T2SS/T4P/T4SS family [Candidatus Aalborgicola defluviihabitans]|uniref:ATPase, T2SS/T4P/T4SS family n=1 Tax=Candidatus Aalborgicola defluviihabitans TaxID=3386187 RepID=UPI001E055FA4|nr:Flp pilus assembly complex ATPase component TadA [Burkholderiales bacterium]
MSLDISERRKPQDGKIKFKKYGPLDIELRGHHSFCRRRGRRGHADSGRRQAIPLEKLGLSPHNKARLEATVSNPYSLFYVCGPTGSGKTTTLHSILSFPTRQIPKSGQLRTGRNHPEGGCDEFRSTKAGIDFALIMCLLAGRPPDIIMVGESRDKETVSMGVEASLTGHRSSLPAHHRHRSPSRD